jgi:4-amino-4-deoxy-L-arabinose transferase-like glycosyltransferase
VSLAWPVLVWLTPAADRPWVSGTSDNSIWSLILDYNGTGRVEGQAGGPGGGAGGGGGGGVFGGDTGITRLVDSSLGGQAGWLIGMAIVGGLAIAVLSRLRRTDARTGWIIAAGGSFATCAVVFSYAQGIFHPYYVSMLAPFTAVLVGAAAGTILRGGVIAPLALLAGLGTEVLVIHRGASDVEHLIPLAVVAVAGGAAVLVAKVPAPVRGVALAVAMGALLIAPATWATEKLGHATSSTFPAGGPASTGFGGGGGPGGGGGGGRGGFGGGPGGGGAPPQQPGAGSSSSSSGATASPPAGFAMGGGTGGATGGAGGMFGGNANLTEALAYAKAHGGGTIGVSSQQGAASAIIASGADVAGIGGFSGSESQVSAQWLAQAVADGRIRYVLSDGTSGFGGRDGRVGATQLMAIVEKVGAETSVSGMYDLQGKAPAILAAANSAS